MKRMTKRRMSAALVGLSVAGLLASSAAASPTGAQRSPELQPATPLSLQLEAPPYLGGGTAAAPLTLITGDQLHVGLDADGQPVVQRITQAPRDDQGTVVFYTLTRYGQSYVVPSDALPLLQEGVLDWELFNPVKLLAHVQEGTIGQVPVIVRFADDAFGPMAFDDGSTMVEFDSINATPMTIEGDGQWWSRVHAGQANNARASARSPLAGVEKVWLNELAHIHLDVSVPQIGTDVAWDLGYDGSGVVVAVLDTGIDPDHPDVAGRIIDAVDFTNSPSGVQDGHGHGTHVAATIAGSGDASDGLRPGVAPGADLLVGKVCGDGGSCTNDAILAGMEWAAQSGAHVVNMSLGGGPTDGTDPLSAAVNDLSRTYGTLFVISAGNSGPGASTVSAPSVADEALSVAAIDKLDEMADFSSRGPRTGDGAFKPEIAGPGVDIVAARAAGTAMGSVVDDFYTTASGTSMSAPHVAGAAAAVAHAHPDLTGSEIKALLMNTAVDLGHDFDAQGMGRVDVGTAVDPSLFAEGNLAFGRHSYPHSPVTRTVTYHNVTDEDITLSFDFSIAAHDGTSGPEGLLAVDSDQLTVPAEGSAALNVTLDGSVLGDDGTYGAYRGRVSATDGEGRLRSTSMVSTVLEPEAHLLTVEIIPPDGAQNVRYLPTIVSPMGTDTSLYDEWFLLPGGNPGQGEVFAGVYTVAGEVRWQDADGAEHLALPMELELVVTGPTTVTLDLREAKQVTVQTPETTEAVSARLLMTRTSPNNAWMVQAELSSAGAEAADHWWVLPTDPVTSGSFTYHSDFAEMTPLVELRAIGGGPPIELDARYGTPHSSVPGVTHVWQIDEETTASRSYDHPVPRIDRRVPFRLVDGGTGTEAELARVNAHGALVLITPTDICAPDCGFAQLQERISVAAAAGAVAVAVAGDTGRITLPNPPTGQVTCENGPDSCPSVETFAELPAVSLTAEVAAQLRDRLRGPAPVRIQAGGSGQAERFYAVVFATDGQVPADLPHQVGRNDLHSVEHRFHSDQPGEVTMFDVGRVRSGQAGAEATMTSLPRTPSQHSVELLVGPREQGVVDIFRVGVDEWSGPLQLTQFDPGDAQISVGSGEEHARILDDHQVLSWNVGAMVPGAIQNPVRADTGESVVISHAPCAGCREGDRFWPTMYLASSAGYTSQIIGLENDTGLAAFLLGYNACQAPHCTITMTDGSGAELEQTLIPAQLVVGSAPSERDGAGAFIPADDRLAGGINVNLEWKGAHR